MSSALDAGESVPQPALRWPWRIGPGTSPRHVRRWLFAVCVLVFVLTMHGRAFSDSRYHFEQIETFVETGLFVMWPADRGPAPSRLAGWATPGLDGHAYSMLPPGQALTATPFALVGRVVGAPELATGAPGVQHAPMMFWASIMMPVAMSAMLVAIFQATYASTGLVSRGLQAALVVGFATNTWFFATTFWTRPLAAACLVIGLVVLLSAKESAWRFSLAGALFGWALVVRPDMVFTLPWLGGLALAHGWRRWPLLAAFALPLVATAIGLLAWNQHRFGDVWSSGSPHQASHDYRLWYVRYRLPDRLFGSKDGLFRYVPALALSIIAIPALWRSQRALWVACFGASATLVVFYSAYVWGQSAPPIAWGSRFLYPVVPLLLLPVFMVPEHAPLRAWWAWLLVAGSVPLQLHGVCQRSAAPVWWMAHPTPAVALVPLVLLGLALWRLVVALDLRTNEPSRCAPSHARVKIECD